MMPENKARYFVKFATALSVLASFSLSFSAMAADDAEPALKGVNQRPATVADSKKDQVDPEKLELKPIREDIWKRQHRGTVNCRGLNS